MQKNSRFFDSPIWKIFVGPRYSNCKYLVLIFVPNLLVALLEGGTFGFILLAFSALSGDLIQDMKIPAWAPGVHLLSCLNSNELFYFLILMAIACQALRGLATFFSIHGTSLLSLKVQIDAQKQVYRQIFRFSFPFISQYKMGDLNEYVKSPSSSIPQFFDCINRALVALFMIFGLLGVLFWISPALTLLTLILFGLFGFTQKVLIKKIAVFSEQLSRHLFDVSHQTIQALQGIRPIHVFHRHGYILDKVAALLDRVAQSSKKAFFWNNMIPAINETVNVVLVGGILVIGSLILSHGHDNVVANLLTYIALTYRLATRMQIGVAAMGSFSVNYGALVRLNEILEEGDKQYLPVGGKELKEWNHEIDFQNVSLQFPNTAKPTLHHLSFTISKGMTIAFVGLSGAGKSSVLDLILGLHDPTEGTIFIDSQPLNSFSHESWRRKIGVVSQDIFIFNDTVEENIRFGDVHATAKQIHQVCEWAGISDMIHNLSEGYGTLIGERGFRLSGGERQRIALARALLKNPEILILDEAMSNLDSCSEHLIHQSLERMQNNQTVIIVAHRLSSIVNADRIIVLEKGLVVEKGRHFELLDLGGRYARLWKLQSEKNMGEPKP
jgi:ATP-binding cassette subfamily B protein/subfamily B ATP-binding cassette protein MsbA